MERLQLYAQNRNSLPRLWPGKCRSLARGKPSFIYWSPGHSGHRLAQPRHPGTLRALIGFSHSSTPETKANKGEWSTSTCPSGQVIAKSNATPLPPPSSNVEVSEYVAVGDWNLLGNHPEAYRAIAYAEKARALAPWNPSVIGRLARLLERKGEHLRAQTLLKELSDERPGAAS
jgi:hypothetical protein